ncbi:hypothetical protein L208DRAFT_1246912, partial [Tricholoma matsutake]
DPIKWADFICRIAQYPASYIIALDEVSKDDWTYAQLWGHSERGTHVEVSQPFVHKHCFSMLAGMVLDEGIVVAQVVEGSFNHDLFLTFLCKDLLPLTTPYPRPHSVIIMDNAHIHHHDDITDLVESYDNY